VKYSLCWLKVEFHLNPEIYTKIYRMNNIMNIFHCIFSLNTGGAETMLIDIANEQVKMAKVSVIIINDFYEQRLLYSFDKRVNVILLRRVPSSLSLWPIIKLNVILLMANPDAIHLHDIKIAPLLFLIRKMKVFLTVHTLNIPSAYTNKVGKLIAISQAVAADMGGRTSTPIVTVPNGINTEIIKCRQNAGIRNGFSIIQVARLDVSNKGQDILIRALSVLKNSGCENVSVDFIGTGDSFEQLQELAKELNVQQNVNFLGLRNRDYIYENLCNYDLMCHPARYEGFGLTVAEGMAAGLPVIVSDEGGPYEIIEKGKYGLAFKMEDANDLADKIQYAIQNYDEMLKVADEARIHVIDNYSVKRMVADYFKVYQGV